MITIKDVAREANVAISTVSNVVNGVDIVSEETKQRVLAAIEKLKYVPNHNARALKTGRKNTVGLFLSGIQGDYYVKLVQAIHLECKMAGYMLNIYIANENTGEEIYGMILSSGVEGAIIMNDSLGNEYVDRLMEGNMPIVFIARECSGKYVSSVIADNCKSCENTKDEEGILVCPKEEEYNVLVNDLGVNAVYELKRLMGKPGNAMGRCVKLVASSPAKRC